jgi:hypothetical protein
MNKIRIFGIVALVLFLLFIYIATDDSTPSQSSVQPSNNAMQDALKGYPR